MPPADRLIGVWLPVNLLSPVTATYLLQIFDRVLSGSLEEARRSWLALIVLFVSVSGYATLPLAVRASYAQY